MGQGWLYEGTISKTGKITILKKEVSFNTYPICLTKGTLIDTPSGPVAVEELYPGMPVWTLDESGQRVAEPVVRTVVTPVPPSWMVVRLVLDDGRAVTASPGHPMADGQVLGDLRAGDALDGSKVVSCERLAYEEGATFDLLPEGASGLYWANGILLGSTLK